MGFLRALLSTAVIASMSAGVPSTPALAVRSTEVRVVKDIIRDADGTKHVRYERTFMGRRVIAGDFVEHINPRGGVTGVSASRPMHLAWNGRVARISSNVAAEAALRHQSEVGDVVVRSTEPVWYNAATGLVSAFDVVVEGVQSDALPVRTHVYVDGESGVVIDVSPEIHPASGTGFHNGTVSFDTTAVASGLFELRDALGNQVVDAAGEKRTDAGTLLTDADDLWGDGTNGSSGAGRQSAGVDAQYGAQKAYDYFFTVFGRRGIWNNGTGVTSFVHYGNGVENAGWTGSAIVYGDGASNSTPWTALDIAAHEMTHGITGNTARLNYSGESGGLNEATSDIFGTAVEFNVNSSADVPDYLIGEKLRYSSLGALRRMDKPSQDGRSPDCWSASVAGMDPHYSSGPLNHWFYLASEGSGRKTINGVAYDSPTCNGSVVAGIGRRAVERVWFRALTVYLTSTSTYQHARDAAIRSATDIFGNNSAECYAVESALNAISVPMGPYSCLYSVGAGSANRAAWTSAYDATLLGTPINTVHQWGPGCIQDFRGGRLGDAALMQRGCTGPVYQVTGAHWRRVASIGSPTIGYPTNNSHRYGASWTQDFDGGTWGWNLLVTPDVNYNNAFVVRTGMRDIWIGAGGADGRWGVPTSDEYFAPVGAKQSFTGGVMTWRAYSDTLSEGQSLGANGKLFSADERFMLVMQDDGNLVLYGPTGAVWASNTVGIAGPRLMLQSGGTLAIYDNMGRQRWSTGTFTFTGTRLVVQSDSNLVLYERSWSPIWTRFTGRLRVDPRGPIAFRSTLTNRYWAAELGFSGGWYGAIRAQRTSVGNLERFQLVGDCRSAYGCAIQNLANGRYLSAELNYTGAGDRMVRARASSIGTWERFQIVGDCGSVGGCGLRSVANGRYLSADYYFTDPNYYQYGLVRARATAISGWESFRIYEV